MGHLCQCGCGQPVAKPGAKWAGKRCRDAAATEAHRRRQAEALVGELVAEGRLRPVKGVRDPRRSNRIRLSDEAWDRLGEILAGSQMSRSSYLNNVILLATGPGRRAP